MNSQPFFRAVAKAGGIILSIFKVFCVIAAIGVLIAVLCLSFLPKNFFTLDVVTQLEMKINLRSVLGENWNDATRQEISTQVQDYYGLSYTANEEGLVGVGTIPSTTTENKTVALAMIPALGEYIILFAFFRFLGKVCLQVRDSVSPFTLPAVQNLKYAGFSLLALGTIPWLCAGLVTLLTGTGGLTETSFNLSTVLWGFFLWALSGIFEYGLSMLPPAASHSSHESDSRQNAENQNHAF